VAIFTLFTFYAAAPKFFSLSEVRFNFKIINIKETKTKAINEPAMLRSKELWALQNQIAKRTSATKSITVRSGYGPDILAGFILFLSNMILGKLVSPQEKQSQKLVYYLN